jgi:hypothetical protein
VAGTERADEQIEMAVLVHVARGSHGEAGTIISGRPVDAEAAPAQGTEVDRRRRRLAEDDVGRA